MPGGCFFVKKVLRNFCKSTRIIILFFDFFINIRNIFEMENDFQNLDDLQFEYESRMDFLLIFEGIILN